MVRLNGNGLSLERFMKVVRDFETVVISEEQQALVRDANQLVRKIVEDEQPVYGINTGFGKLADVPINKCDTATLQENLLKSHACGVGEPLSEEIVRGMMLLRINALVRGNSGIRLKVVEKLVEMLNKQVHPVVFEKGSLGASGDLAPLSHMSLPIIGLGECFVDGERMTTQRAFTIKNIDAIPHLEAKEGLSLINGTQAMTSIGAIALFDAFRLASLANVSLAMTMEATGGIIDAYDPRVHKVRGHLGQIAVAAEVLKHLKGSRHVTRQGEARVQDAYSIRCAPQVHGATIDALLFIREKVEIEMNAVTDNPILFTEDGAAISAGNFHGQPLALPFDYLGIALSELANISERRIERMVNPALSNGLPPFLVKNPGLNSGFMIVQYSAASLVSENKVLAHPASVDSIPSSANQEDHVSMGTIGARKAYDILKNARRVVAMELMTACQAIDLKPHMALGRDTEKAYNEIRKHVPFVEDDEIMYHHIHKMEQLLSSGELESALFKEETE